MKIRKYTEINEELVNEGIVGDLVKSKGRSFVQSKADFWNALDSKLSKPKEQNQQNDKSEEDKVEANKQDPKQQQRITKVQQIVNQIKQLKLKPKDLARVVYLSCVGKPKTIEAVIDALVDAEGSGGIHKSYYSEEFNADEFTDSEDWD